MNINTNTFLNNFINKIDSTIKAKIEKLSVDGKIDLTNISKDKGIQRLLSDMFKDISSGVKNKAEVATLLENSKHSLKFKNISTDVKQIINVLNSELTDNPKVEKLTTSLKNSLIDIKNLDEKILKSTFQNNGVMLESKISNSTISVSNNLEKLSDHLNANLKILNNFEKVLSSDIFSLKNDITSLKSTVEINHSKLQKIITTNNELTPNNKNEIQTLINKIDSVYSVQNEPTKIETNLNNLNEIVTQIDKMELKNINLTSKNEIVLNLKELTQQAKHNILNTTSTALNKIIMEINDQIENIKSDSTSEIKTEIKKLETQIKALNNEKNPEVKILLNKEVISETTKIIDTIKNANLPDLLKHNINNMKNVSNDVKNIMLQMKEIIEDSNNNETISKELKNSVDKVLSQIDYYQLSSYSTNSTHGYLSFLQEDLNDVDMKFSNTDNEEFSCLINLSLKDKGDLKILLQLDNNKNLNINIGVEQEEFKEMIQENLQKFRLQINSLGLSIVTLNVFDLNEDSIKSDELKAYENNSNLDFGIDIKV